MTERTNDELERENAYLRARVAQLENDLTDIAAENSRLREERERTHARRAARPPNALGSGQ
jgi:predicted nuclease with TOPRIM domain